METFYDTQSLIDDEIESLEGMTCDIYKFQQAVIWGTDWTTETLNNQLVKGNIDLNPSFQRRDAWTDSEKSKLIESLMLGLPVPPIILAENKNKKNSYIVIDGKQRLLSIRRFFSDTKESGFEPLKLRSLTVLKELNGTTITTIRDKYSEYIRNIENQTIRAIIIKNWPDEPFLYTVFLRLNTGSKKLSPQELRQALKPGKFLDYLDEATANSDIIKKMLGNKSADTRMKDIEITLRFFAYYYFFNEYTGNLKEFLDMTCEKLNASWDEKEEEIKSLFAEYEKTIEFCFEIMNTKSPFSRYSLGESGNRFNRSIFELFTFYFINDNIKELVKEDCSNFITLFKQMNDDPDFVTAVSGSTKEISNLAVRFSKFQDILKCLKNAESASIPKVELFEGKLTITNFPC